MAPEGLNSLLCVGLERSKTGEYDDSIPLDSSYMKKPWAPVLFAQLKKATPDAPLWDFNYSLFSSMFYQAFMMSAHLSMAHSPARKSCRTAHLW